MLISVVQGIVQVECVLRVSVCECAVEFPVLVYLVLPSMNHTARLIVTHSHLTHVHCLLQQHL